MSDVKDVIPDTIPQLRAAARRTGGFSRSVPHAEVIEAVVHIDEQAKEIAALRAKAKALATALDAVLDWATKRCPCENEEPNPCPLCGADANIPGDCCKAVDATIPLLVLTTIRAALSAYKGGGATGGAKPVCPKCGGKGGFDTDTGGNFWWTPCDACGRPVPAPREAMRERARTLLSRLQHWFFGDEPGPDPEALAYILAALIQTDTAAREACAKIGDRIMQRRAEPDSREDEAWISACMAIVAAIRESKP